MVYKDAVWHGGVTAIIVEWKTSKPVTKQRDWLFGLYWCCMQLRGFIDSKENYITKMSLLTADKKVISFKKVLWLIEVLSLLCGCYTQSKGCSLDGK